MSTAPKGWDPGVRFAVSIATQYENPICMGLPIGTQLLDGEPLRDPQRWLASANDETEPKESA